ncbi:Histone chaperone RTT106 [Termitomyces sp. J132]|nr:Histone chaperone RTT106 [Termitomyces sp. J132]
MASETPFLRAILPSLPSDFAKKVRALCASTSESTAEHILDTLIRFISGAECAPSATVNVQSQWTEKQQAAATILNGMVKGRSKSETKRPREDDISSDEQAAKRQRSLVEAPAASSTSTSQELLQDPLFTVHSVSATSPVRKKVDITIHKTSLALTHPSTHAVEAVILLSTFSRAFLLPTRGKQKAHWTIVLLTSDTSETRKPQNGSTTSNTQVIFGIDAIALVSSTKYEGTNPIRSAGQKGAATRPTLLEFLSQLSIPIIEPTPNVFKSACVGITSGVSANEDGVPGIEAYRGAKLGSLWFTEKGILWGESKPCEFWALEDLIGKSEGIRVIGGDNEDVGEDEEDMGVETEFGMVDSKEKPGIEGWMRKFRGSFGKKTGKSEDFEMDTDEELDGSEESSSEESDDEGENDGSGEEREGSDEEGEDDGENEDEEELTEEHHPLLRPGAMPRRMNRAVIDMVVGMVEDEMLGTPNEQDPSSDGEDGEGEEEELEEDELDD